MTPLTYRGPNQATYAMIRECLSVCMAQDGDYFLSLVDSEQNRLQQMCCRTERHLQEPDETIPEEG